MRSPFILAISNCTPHNFEVKAGKTTSLTVENMQVSSMLIHKIDSVTGKGIYGVTFLVIVEVAPYST